MRHLWWVSAVYLLAAFGTTYWIEYDWLEIFLSEEETAVAEENPEDQARIALISSLLFCGGVAISLRRSHWGLSLANQWSFWRTAWTVAILLVFVKGLALASRQMAEAVNEGHFPDLGTAEWRMEMILAVGKHYGLGALLLLLVVLAPWVEEFVFRGIMLDSMQRHLPFHVANLIQATFFGLIHEDLQLLLFFIAFGWIAGLLRRETGGLAVPLLFHATNNLLAFFALQRLLP